MSLFIFAKRKAINFLANKQNINKCWVRIMEKEVAYVNIKMLVLVSCIVAWLYHCELYVIEVELSPLIFGVAFLLGILNMTLYYLMCI